MKLAYLLLTTAFLSYGQKAAEPPKYEVASIKPNDDNDVRLAFRIDPDGTLSATGITLKRLMMSAFNVQGFRILGGPDWLSSGRWDIQAKPDRSASPDQVRHMLQVLLEDRFQLRLHSEKRSMQVYELSIDRKGLKLPRAKDNEKPDLREAPGSIQLIKVAPAAFVGQLSYALGRPVIDKTGLSGEFDFMLEWTPEPGEDGGPTNAGLPPVIPQQPASNPNGPSIFTAIPDQLGLRLKSGRGLVEVIVIDRVQMPTAN